MPATVDRPMAPKELGGLQEVAKPEAPNLTEIMFEELKQQNQRFIPGLTATLTTFGIPHIKPGCFVVVENVGSLYDGTYALHGVTHSWSGQAIESTLTLRSYTPQVSNVVEGVVKPSANLSGSQQ